MSDNKILLVASILPNGADLTLTDLSNVMNCLSFDAASNTGTTTEKPYYKPYLQALDGKDLKGFVDASLSIHDLNEVAAAAKFASLGSDGSINSEHTIIICRDSKTIDQLKAARIYGTGTAYATAVTPGFGSYPENYDPRRVCHMAHPIRFSKDQTLSVETPAGTLKAHTSGVSDYPEIYITVQPKDKDESYEVDLVSAEVDLSENPENKTVTLRMYADPYTEDYTDKKYIDTADIVKAIESADENPESESNN